MELLNREEYCFKEELERKNHAQEEEKKESEHIQ